MSFDDRNHDEEGDFKPYEAEDDDLFGDEEARRDELIRVATDQSALDKIELLSRELSRSKAEDEPLKIDPNDFDLKSVLKSFTSAARKQGIELKSSGVSVEGLTVTGVDLRFAIYPTVGDLLKLPLTIIRKIRQKTTNRKIIDNFNCLAKNGEMVLVLGRPGSGCSTLLKALSGTDRDLYTDFSGEVLFDGIAQKEMIKRFKNDLIYCPELDIHFPHLTVEQTLKFAIACKTPKLRINDVRRNEYINAFKDILTTVFGLRHTHHTKVGNDFVRGISGGERKRVSIAEALACQGTLYCWDNATRGLDASTALEYAQAIRICTNLLKNTAFVAIYQAGENIYNTFDKVTVLYKGKQIYFGSVSQAKAYFEGMGFQCPPRQATAEFLTAMTDPTGRFPKPGYERKVPNTPEEFESYWHNSREFQTLMGKIDEYKMSSDRDATERSYLIAKKQAAMKFQSKSHYTIDLYQQVKLCTIRGFQRIWGDKAYTLTHIGAAISQGLIAGSLYYNTPGDVRGAFSRGGVIFFSALYVSLMGLAEISASFSSRTILMKQKNYTMYHPAADAVASTMTSVPTAFLVTVTFVVVIYFLSGMKSDAGNFFIFLLFVFILNMTMSGLFQAVAALNKTVSDANAFAGIMVLATLLYSSYMIQRPSMHPWFEWISYINPIFYAFEAIIASEFHGRRMECVGTYLVPNGPSYSNVGPGEQSCAFKGSIEGQSYVLGDRYLDVAYTYKFDHVWRNFGILIGFFAFFTFIKTLGVEYIKPISGGGDRLLFLSNNIPPEFPISNEKSDLESGSETAQEVESSGEEKKLEAFESLKSKDIFVWKNVNYVIKADGKDRTLLDNVSGYCIPGTLTALMGESGAGKTTLLNCLAQRLDIGVVTGDMLVNGRPLTHSFKRRTGYVQQQDIHLSQCTVKESLIFAARLRRPKSVSDKEKRNYVDKIMEALDMDDFSEAIVGDLGNGLNVEQRKKLSIGVELVAKPSLLLFLDEPTSGLDSQSAWGIVRVLRRLAEAGQSILCTIHQPSATLFEQFDRLLLLQKGGQTVYFGDIGRNSSILIDYFEKQGARKCGKAENPAEYILDVIGAGANAHATENWHEIWESSAERVSSDEKRDELISDASKIDNSEAESEELNSTFAVPYYYQFIYVLRRNALTFWRNPEYIMAKTFLMVFAGLFIGFTFFGLKDTLTGMQNAMFTGFIAVVVSAPVINQIQEQAINGRDLYEARESMSNTYHYSLLIITQAINEYPYLVVGATLMFVSLYFPTKSDFSGPHAGVFYLTQGIFLQAFVVSFGLLILYISPDLPSAAILTSFFYTFIVAFSGIVQPTQLMPGFWTFMNKVSPYTYLILNLISCMLHDRPVRCADNEFAYFNPPEGQTCGEYTEAFLQHTTGYISNPNATAQCEYCTYSVGDEYLEGINALYSHIWRNVGFYCVYVGFNLGLTLILYWLFRVRRISLTPVVAKFKKK